MESLRDFMCVCSEESKAKCEEVLAWAYEDMSASSEDLLTKVVYGLQWSLPEDFVGNIEGIGCDMWAGIAAYVQKFNKETKKYEDFASIYVQCDELEHGIARVWQLAKEACE